MSFKPEYLKSIGIQPDTVPQTLTVRFTDVNHSRVRVTDGDIDVIIEGRVKGCNTQSKIDAEVAKTLVSAGAKATDLNPARILRPA